MHDQKNTIIQGIGERIDAKLGSDPRRATKQALGERRLQTWLLSVGIAIMSGIALSIITTFAGIPGQVSRVADEVSTSRDETAATLARIERRIDGGDAKDHEHDSALQALMRRVDRNEYVLSIAPATREYAHEAHIRKPPKPDPEPSAKPAPVVKPDDR